MLGFCHRKQDIVPRCHQRRAARCRAPRVQFLSVYWISIRARRDAFCMMRAWFTVSIGGTADLQRKRRIRANDRKRRRPRMFAGARKPPLVAPIGELLLSTPMRSVDPARHLGRLSKAQRPSV